MFRRGVAGVGGEYGDEIVCVVKPHLPEAVESNPTLRFAQIMTKPTGNSADPFKKALAALAVSFLAMAGLVSHSFAETPQRCGGITDFKMEFERLFSSDPNVVAKCDVDKGTNLHFADPFGPFPNGGTMVSEGTYTFVSDKIEVVNGIVYLRRYGPRGLDCGDIEDPPSYILLEDMTCQFRSQVKP